MVISEHVAVGAGAGLGDFLAVGLSRYFDFVRLVTTRYC